MTGPGDAVPSGQPEPGPSAAVEPTHGVVQVLDRSGKPVGAGFLVAEGLIVTCAHVLVGTGAGQAAPTDPVRVRFARLDETSRRARVSAAHWRAPSAGDVAFLRLEDPAPAPARPLPLGTAGAARRPVKMYGFPSNAPAGGHYGYAVTGDRIHGDNGAELLQLTDCTEATEGFSGGPVIDESTGLVIGMLDSIAAPDRHARGRSTGYVTPTETLRAIHPDLRLSQVCPYPGLRAFTTADAAWFHGRDRAVAAVLASLDRHPPFLALLGPSGSGKSSLMQAGVRPALNRAELPGSDRWGWVTARPGADPYANLAHAGLPGAQAGLDVAVRRWRERHPDASRLVLVLDQFEELLVGPAEPRARLLRELAELPEREPTATVVLTLRDDFYSRLAAAAPAVMTLVERGLVNVPATLSARELAAIIERPATAAGLALEPGLTERIARDAARVTGPPTAAASAPTTVLPLLSSALAELWRRREAGRLTHAAYDRIGGVTGWLDRWCDQAYADACAALTPDRAPLVRQVITALVRPGDEGAGVPATRQRRTLDELRAAPGPPANPDAAPAGPRADPETVAVVAVLADRRLVTTGRDAATGEPVVELAHEALIHEWASLRRWLVEDHEFLTWRRTAEAAQAQWRASTVGRPGPDPELLLHGSALEAAQEWANRRPGAIPPDLAAYVRLSIAAQQRRLRRDRRRVAVLAGLLVLTGLLGGFAVVQRQEAQEQAAQAVEEARRADARRLAVQAGALAERQPDLALLLALEGLRTAPGRDAWSALGLALSRPVALSRVLSGHGAGVRSVALSPDGTLLASVEIGRDPEVRLWDVASGRQVGTLSGGPRADQAVAFSPDGRFLATSGIGDGIALWELSTSTPTAYRLTDRGSLLGAVTFSPDGRLLAGISGGGGAVQFWELPSRRPLGPSLNPRSGNLTDLAFSPDGRVLVSTSESGVVDYYDVPRQRVAARLRMEKGAMAAAFSPDGRLLAVGGEAGVVYLLSTDRRVTGEPLRLAARLRDLAFQPGTGTLVTGDTEGVIQQWDLRTRRPAGPALRGHAGQVDALAFNRAGTLLVSGGTDRRVRLWDLSVRQPLGASIEADARQVADVAFSPDGAMLATAGFDRSTRLWDVASRRQVGAPMTPDGKILDPNELISGDPVRQVTFGGDGRSVTAVSTRAIRRWEVPGGRLLADRPVPNETDVVLAPGGDHYAAWPAAGEVQVRSLASGEPVGRPLPGDKDISVAFRPDGRQVATANGIPGRVRIWDVATGDRVAEGEIVGDGPGGFTVDSADVMAVSPDGAAVVTSNGFARPGGRIWRRDGDELHDHELPYGEELRAAAFSPDNRVLAIAGADGSIQFWDAARTAPIADRVTLHSREVTGVTFSPDGELLASAAADGAVRLWAAPTTWVRHACELAGRNLTREEWDRYLPGRAYVRNCPQHPSGHGADPQAPGAVYPSPY